MINNCRYNYFWTFTYNHLCLQAKVSVNICHLSCSVYIPQYCSLNYIAILLFYTSLYHQKYQALIPPNNYNRSLIRQFCTSLTSNAKPSYILKSSRALTTRCTILNDQNMASFPCMPTSAKPIEHLRPQFPAKYKNHPFTASNMQTVRCVYLPLSKTRNIISLISLAENLLYRGSNMQTIPFRCDHEKIVTCVCQCTV